MWNTMIEYEQQQKNEQKLITIIWNYVKIIFTLSQCSKLELLTYTYVEYYIGYYTFYSVLNLKVAKSPLYIL